MMNCARNFAGLTLMAAAGVLMAAPAVWAQKANVEGAWWHADLSAAQAAAATDGRRVMIYFYNREARPCREMEKTLADPRVAERLAKAACVAVNNQMDYELAERFRLIKVPTVIFLGADDKEIDRTVGFKTPEDFAEFLDRALDTTTTKAEFAQAAVDVTAPRDGTTAVELKISLPEATSVSVAGDFNDWKVGNNPLTQTPGTTEWTGRLYLREGIYEYLFVDDKGVYHEDTANPTKVFNPYGKFNSVIVVGDAKSAPHIEGNTVTFIVYRPDAKSIQVGGSFNNWQPLTMFRNPKDGAMWGVRYSNLTPGEYRYKFVIDGNWEVDPENLRPVTEGDGTVNSSFVIR